MSRLVHCRTQSCMLSYGSAFLLNRLPPGAVPKQQNPRLELFRENPGTLEEHLWKRQSWQLPENETISCWYGFGRGSAPISMGLDGRVWA